MLKFNLYQDRWYEDGTRYRYTRTSRRRDRDLRRIFF